MAEEAARRLLAELKQFGDSGTTADDIPPALRSQLLAAIRHTETRAMTPVDTVIHILLEHPTHFAIVQAGAEMRLFSTLQQTGGRPMSIKELSETVHTDPVLLCRFLRVLAAFGALEGNGEEGYTLPPAYTLFAQPEFEKAYGPTADFDLTVLTQIPAYLRTHGRSCDIVDPLNTVVQHSYGVTGVAPMQIPAVADGFRKHFSKVISLWADGWTRFEGLFPIEQLAQSYDSACGTGILFVDVGGGLGTQVRALKRAHPELPGRFVVQDLFTIDAIDPSLVENQGIEFVKYDFFHEQPVRGARVYYLRTILQNWADARAVQILRIVSAALTPGYSSLIVHEAIVADRSPSRWAVVQDMLMMATFAAGQRTLAQLRILSEEAGLRLVKIYQDDNPAHEMLLEFELA